MNISLNWLKEYLKIDLSVEKVCEILTSIGLEVGGYEKFESIRGGLRGLVIGEVKTCEAHPDSDHLHLTTVDLGDGRLTPIVCGAPNVAAGQKVVVATIGTVLYDGDKEFSNNIFTKKKLPTLFCHKRHLQKVNKDYTRNIQQKIKNQRTGIRRNDLCRR